MGMARKRGSRAIRAKSQRADSGERKGGRRRGSRCLNVDKYDGNELAVMSTEIGAPPAQVSGLGVRI